MAYQGSLSDSPFPEVLQHVGRTAGTGILTLQGRDEIIGVTFLDGEVVSVDAVNQPPEDGLGYVLAVSGLVSREDFSVLVAENQAGGGRVIDLLVERGYINRRQLLEALRQQTLRLCAEACSWESGQFRFYRGDQVSYEHGIEPINVDDLLAKLAVGPERPAAAAVAEPEPAASRAPAWLTPDAMPSPSGARPLAAPDAGPAVEILGLEPRTPKALAVEMPAMAPPAVEMPDPEAWRDEDEPAGRRRSRPWLDVDWTAVRAPQLPGRLLGIGLLVALAALVLLAPDRFLVPLEAQERIRTGMASEVLSSLFGKVDRAAKTYFLLRGRFPADLRELIALDLLAPGDDRLADDRRLSYTAAPVSYLLAIEGEARLDASTRTETISGNFLLDPEFSPPELLATPPLVLLD